MARNEALPSASSCWGTAVNFAESSGCVRARLVAPISGHNKAIATISAASLFLDINQWSTGVPRFTFRPDKSYGSAVLALPAASRRCPQFKLLYLSNLSHTGAFLQIDLDRV